jgi:hypothetical protein
VGITGTQPSTVHFILSLGIPLIVQDV